MYSLYRASISTDDIISSRDGAVKANKNSPTAVETSGRFQTEGSDVFRLGLGDVFPGLAWSMWAGNGLVDHEGIRN
jgi:hypothetical protein